MTELKFQDKTELSRSAANIAGFGAWIYSAQKDTLSFDAIGWSFFGIDPAFAPDLTVKFREVVGKDQFENLLSALASHEGSTEFFAELSFCNANKPSQTILMRGGKNGGETSGLVWDCTNDTKKLTLALEGSGFGVWEFEQSTQLLRWDQRMHQIYGFAKDTFSGDPNEWRKCLHPD